MVAVHLYDLHSVGAEFPFTTEILSYCHIIGFLKFFNVCTYVDLACSTYFTCICQCGTLYMQQCAMWYLK